jgi:O-antigen/teichoic acid export membrane protein
VKTLAVRNGLWNALANAVGAVTGMLGSIVIVRGLTADEYGVFSYYVWLAGILTAAGTLALPNALTKIGSELRGEGRADEADSLARTVTLALIGLTLLYSLGLGLYSWLGADPAQRPYLAILAVVLAPTALSTLLRSTLWGEERYKPVSLATLVATVAQLPAIALVALTGWGAPGFVGAMLGVNVIQAVGLALALRRSPRPPAARFRSTGWRWPAGATWRRYGRFAAPATALLVFDLIVWQRSGVFFLQRSSTLEQVGYYSLAYTVFSACLMLGWALVQGYYPAISRDYGARDWTAISGRLRQALLLATVYAVPLSLGGWVTLNALMSLLYGEKMLPAVAVGQILLVGLLPGVAAAVLGLTISAAGAIWLHVPFGLGLSALNIVLSLTLTPRYGAVGAALASTLTQITSFAISLVAVQRLFGIQPPWRLLLGVVLVGLLTTLLVPLLVQYWLPGFWGLGGAILFAGALYLAGTWRFGHLQPLGVLEGRR